MSIGIRKVDDSYGIWDGYNCEFINPEYLGISEKKIRKYLKENPFPEDPEYSEKDMIFDLTNSSGSLIIHCKFRKTAEFIAQMIRDLI